jgi:hypothetical protein
MSDEIITYWDWILSPFYIIVIFVIASFIKNKGIRKSPIYKYFLNGLLVKIIGGISVCLIYVYYYKQGGDTLVYNSDSSALLKLLFYSPGDFFKAWFSPFSKETMSYFTAETGTITYGRDANVFMVDRLLVPLKLIGFDSYLVTSILMASVSFTGIWKIYVVFCDNYPSLYKQFAIAILFIPSVVFWGSGMLKDSWTIAAAGWYFYSFYSLFIKRRAIVMSSFTLVISAAIMILIKPYIFLGLLPGTLLWMTWSRLSKIKNHFIKVLIGPIILIGGMGVGFLIWSLTGSNLGDYRTLDSMLQKAVESSEDLKQDYYQGNSFDLGKYDPTITGLLSKFPIATATGLFRPFLWETKNVVMFASGLENFFVLFFVLYTFFRKPWITISCLLSDPLVLFSLIFAVFFAFSVAISTSNFGSMVRLRIPMFPFLLSGFIIINSKVKTVIRDLDFNNKRVMMAS